MYTRCCRCCSGGCDTSRNRKKRKAISIMQIKVVRGTLHDGCDCCVCVCVIYARGDDDTPRSQSQYIHSPRIFPTLAVSPPFVQQPSLSIAFYYKCLSLPLERFLQLPAQGRHEIWRCTSQRNETMRDSVSSPSMYYRGGACIYIYTVAYINIMFIKVMTLVRTKSFENTIALL